MALKRLTQVAMQLQSQEDTGIAHSALFAAANVGYLPIDPDLTFDFEQIKRNILRGTLTPAVPLSGSKRGAFKTDMEFCGSGVSLANPPQWDAWIRSCGMRRETLTKLTVPALAARVPHGQRYSQTTSLAEFTTIGQYEKGDTTIWVTKSNGLGTASTAINVTDPCAPMSGYSGDTFTPSVRTANAGFGYFPAPIPLISILFDATGTLAAVAPGDVLVGATSKAKAFVTSATGIAANGVVYAERLSGHFSTGETINRVSPTATTIGVLAAASFEDQMTGHAASIGWARQAVRESIMNARGSWGFKGVSGQPGVFTFDGFKGMLNDQTTSGIEDGPNVASPANLQQLIPPLFVGTAFQVGDDTTSFDAIGEEVGICIANLEIKMQNVVELATCSNASTGYKFASIVDRNPQLTIDPELNPEAFFAFMAKYRDSSPFRCRFTLGVDLGNRIHVSIPGAVINASGNGEQESRWNRQLTCTLTSGSTGNALQENEVVIVYPVL